MIQQIYQFILGQLHTNPFFAGATMTGVILATLNYLRKWATYGLGFLWKRATVSMKVHSEDPLYTPLMQWLNKHRFDYLIQHYRLKTKLIENDSLYDYEYDIYNDSGREPQLDAVFGPDYGNYFFRFSNRWLKVNVIHEDQAIASNKNDEAQTRDFLTIRYLGFSKTIMNKIVEGAIQEYYEQKKHKLTIYQSSHGGWREMGHIDRYVEGSEHVILDGDLLEKIEREVKKFFSSKQWYNDRGIPWRRGFMLQGPPGTGKTSLCRHLASKYKMNIYVVSPSSYTNESLGQAMRFVQPRSILLFEDIDRSLAMASENKKNKNKENETLEDSLGAMLRGNLGVLLNAIDGIAPAEGMLLIMTSNDTKELDPALTRPGRIDKSFHLGLCTKNQALKMFKKFYPEATSAQEMGFIAGFSENTLSAAELQEQLISTNPASYLQLHQPPELL